MKTLKNLIIIFIVLNVLVSLVVSKSKKSHKSQKSHKSYKSHHTNKNFPTPKALDLQNHFGLPEVGSPYGVETSMAENVERNPEVYTPQRFNKWKDVEREFTKFHPFAGWEDKLNPHHIKSGEFKNVAPAASKLVNPEITGPKLHVQAEVSYPAHTKLPTFYGYRKTLQPVTAYDKLERKIINDHVVINKPLYGWEDQVTTIKRNVDQIVDLRSGERLNKEKPLNKHGIDNVDVPPVEPKRFHGKKLRRLRRF